MNKITHPDRLSSYFKKETFPLITVTVSGLIYNIGLTAGPYFEGQLVQKLCNIIKGTAAFSEMIWLALTYFFVILAVQGARCLKRFYVRRFANNTSFNMRHILYSNLVHKSKKELSTQSAGTLMTKAISDVDACTEGMRKFTTEVFDTGIALIAYFVMMLRLDWRLGLISGMFVPAAYFIAQKMKVFVCRYNERFKKCAGRLSDATLTRVAGAVTYRVFGQEENRDEDYEKHLDRYEKSAVMAGIWENTLQPVYNIISMTGAVFILYIGSRNVTGTGFAAWDIAAFTAFLSCFAKMSLKSSKAAKLFNSVAKAQVSWNRIKPLLAESQKNKTVKNTDADTDIPVTLEVRNLAFGYDGQTNIFSGVSFSASAGDIIGVTGPVACGKSSLGKAFLCEDMYTGSILINSRELSSFSDCERNTLIAYLGHQPELLSDTIEENIKLGDDNPTEAAEKAVCLDTDISLMPEGRKTLIGSSAHRLSGGQQDRLALARTLYHKRKIIILDDPFSSVDMKTEKLIMNNLKSAAPDSIFLIISHRITQFSEFSAVIWMDNKNTCVSTHDTLMQTNPQYAKIFDTQSAGGDLYEK